MTAVLIPLWGVLILGLPGWVVWRFLGPRGIAWPLQIAPAFAISLAVVCALGWAAFVLGLGFSAVRAAALVLAALALVFSPFAFRRRRTVEGEPVGLDRAVWAGVAVAALAVVAVLYTGPWLSLTADTFYHLAAVRSILQHGTALPQEVFFSTPVSAADPTSGSWPLALALVSNLAGADPLEVWRFATVATAPLTVLAFFFLALTLTRLPVAAALATALYVVAGLSLDFRASAYPNRFGSLLGWLAVVFAVRWARGGSRGELAIAMVIAFGASAVHPAMSPFLLVVLGCAALGAMIFASPARRRLVIAAVLVAIAAIPLMFVNIATLNTTTPYVPMALAAPLPLRTIDRPWHWVWVGFWFRNAATLLGTVFLVPLFRFWRAGEIGAGLLTLALLSIPVAAMSPFFASTYSAQYLLVRVAGVIAPLAWIAFAWGFALAIQAVRARPTLVPATAVLIMSAVAITPSLYQGPWGRLTRPAGSLSSFANSKSTDLTVRWRDRLAALAALPPGAVILAEPGAAYEVAGLTGREIVAVPYSHTPHAVLIRDAARRREDSLDAVEGRLDSADLAGVLEHYRAAYVMVDTDHTTPEAWAKLASAPILQTVASGSNWRLYRYDPDGLATYADLSTTPGPAPDIARSGIGPAVVVSGRAVLVRIDWAAQPSGHVRLTARGVSQSATFGRDISGSGTFALTVPLDAPVDRYQVNVAAAGQSEVQLGEFSVARLFQGEDLGGIVPGNTSGWTTTMGDQYLGTLAADAVHPGSLAHQSTSPIDAGDYCVAARVSDDGSGRANSIQIALTGSGTDLSWSGTTRGLKWVTGTLRVDSQSSQLTMRAVQRGQGAIIVDALELYAKPSAGCG